MARNYQEWMKLHPTATVLNGQDRENKDYEGDVAITHAAHVRNVTVKGALFIHADVAHHVRAAEITMVVNSLTRFSSHLESKGDIIWLVDPDLGLSLTNARVGGKLRVGAGVEIKAVDCQDSSGAALEEGKNVEVAKGGKVSLVSKKEEETKVSCPVCGAKC